LSIFTPQLPFWTPGDKKMRGVTIKGSEVGRLRSEKRGRQNCHRYGIVRAVVDEPVRFKRTNGHDYSGLRF